MPMLIPSLVIFFISNIVAASSSFGTAATTNSTSEESQGFTLELIHRDSPASPIYPGNLTQSQRIQRLIDYTNARADRLAPNVFGASSGWPIRLPVSREGFVYVVSLSIGTPPITYQLILDTASQLTWVQCTCSNPSFPQEPIFFNPDKSSQASIVLCDNPLCRGLECVNDRCFYDVHYSHGKSRTKGVIYKDTMSKKGRKPLTGVAFGCSSESHGFRVFQEKIHGFMGMNQDGLSIPSQLGLHFQHKFSYCLSEQPVTSLRFGSNAAMSSRNAVVTTPLKGGRGASKYYVNLLDIGFSGRWFRFPPGTFDTRGSGGIMIDTGAAFTLLIRHAYDRVVAAMSKHFSEWRFERVEGRQYGMNFDYCWEHRLNAIPGMVFHFEGGDLVVSHKNLYFFSESPFKFFCLAMGPHDAVSVLGVKQQQDTRFMFDLHPQQLRFVATDCSKF